VYCPTRNSVLHSKFWCTAQQEIVYSTANFGVLPNKAKRPFFLQMMDFEPRKIALPVIVVYIVVYLNNREEKRRDVREHEQLPDR
jgi:hypothetical protein